MATAPFDLQGFTFDYAKALEQPAYEAMCSEANVEFHLDQLRLARRNLDRAERQLLTLRREKFGVG